MTLSPKAVKEFLAREFPRPPPFKGMPPDQVKAFIKQTTGKPYRETTESRPHQLEGVGFALWMKRCLLFYWMRLGKTKMALDWCAQLHRSGLVHETGLIIAHAPVGVTVWSNEIKKHSTLRAKVVRSGPRAIDSFLEGVEGKYDVVIISRYTLQGLFTIKKASPKGPMKLYPDHEKLRLAARLFDHCIIDETHFYSRSSSLPYKLVRGITRNCEYRIGLTGTPVGRNPFMIWAQTMLIDDGARFGTNFNFFQIAFGKRNPTPFSRFNYDFDKSKMPLFKARLDTIALSYGKGEVKTAEVQKSKVELKMHAEQKKTYNDAVAKIVRLRFDESAEIDAIFTRLRQIASGFLPFVDNEGQTRILHFPSAKLDWVEAFAAELPRNMQAILFHEFIHSGELISERLSKHKVSHVRLFGGTRHKDQAIEAFQKGKARVLVANTATGGTAIDLPQADYLCFFESPCSPIVRAQAEARPMGRSKDRLLTLDDLVAAPIEERILGFIQEGENFLRALTRPGKNDLRKSLFAR